MNYVVFSLTFRLTVDVVLVSCAKLQGFDSFAISEKCREVGKMFQVYGFRLFLQR